MTLGFWVHVKFIYHIVSLYLLSYWRCLDYMAVGCVLSPDVRVTLDVLNQLVNHTSLHHKLHTVVIVIILSDVDRQTVDQFVQTIAARYLYELNIGFIQLLQQATSVTLRRPILLTYLPPLFIVKPRVGLGAL